MASTLEHPFHEHALVRRVLSERCTFDCNICTVRVRGAAYCCEDHTCSFFLHESCALVEFPETKRKLHLKHRLVLMAALHPPQEDDVIHHFAHDHPLAAIHMKVPNWIICNGCQERVGGPAYGCQTCLFFLHELCARLPQEMLQHPFHPHHKLTLPSKFDTFRCKACRARRYNQLAYYCQECKFKLDVTCAALPVSLQDQEEDDRIAVDHFSHRHQLVCGRVEETKHSKLCCAVCEQKISGEVYYCLGCIFFLHKLCADELPREMSHYLHPEHPLVLLPKPPHQTEPLGCNCCGYDCSGMVFHCASCEFNIDPNCALRTSSALRDEAASAIQHSGHEHPLVLRYLKEVQIPDNCNACHEPAVGLAYCCRNCGYVLHKSCAELPPQLDHPLHSPHPLILAPTTRDKRFICDSCSSLSRGTGFSFSCNECVFYLCIPCATKRPTLKHPLHEHILSYFRRGPAADSVVCNSCGEPCSIDLYCCTPCNFNLHIECLPLPPTVQHECHPYHPLVLLDGYVYGRPDDQWCDYCEEIRHPDHGVYRCEECWYTVHIGCVLPLVTQQKNPYLGKLRGEIARLEEDLKVMEKDLEDSKEKLNELKSETCRQFAKT